ncbi:hypothetical protein EVAR_70803_1 [Eumeta japonica]|uniref:Uncharacterized protein n=1 Tax=Eumeta variegata TaxID=151549 RepID=A0A4C1SEE5_EUMVA|nr:hypothetical protein EVAR_70803_1 [Eumeta japonica]
MTIGSPVDADSHTGPPDTGSRYGTVQNRTDAYLLEIAFFVLTFDSNYERLSNRQCTGRMLRSREDTRPFCRLEATTDVILLMHFKRAYSVLKRAYISATWPRLTPFCRERDERVANAQ